jgi:6-phosphogluconolactonase
MKVKFALPVQFFFVALLLLGKTSAMCGAELQSDASSVIAANPAAMRVYIGTYTHGKGPAESKGIYCGQLDLATGKVTIDGVTPTVEPSFLAIDSSRQFLYAVNEVEKLDGVNAGGVSAFAIDSKSGELKPLNRRPSEGTAPCHLSIDKDRRVVLVANYGNGSIAALRIEPDGSLGKSRQAIPKTGASVNRARQEGPHAHCISLDPANHFALEADLGLDLVFVYAFDANRRDAQQGVLAYKSAGDLKPGSGPRHFVFSRDGRFVYVINELASTISTFAYDAETGGLRSLATHSTLPKGFSGSNTTAEIDVDLNGRFLYGSNRGHDSIVIFSINPDTGMLTYVGHQPSGGKTPRSFGIDPTGRYMLVANQDSNNVVVMRIDQQTGKLTPTGNSVEIGMPVCVKMIPAP